MTKKLLPRQEKFCQGVASGLSQSDAYRQAYPLSKRWGVDAVNNNAYKLMKIPEIYTRVEEIKKQIETKVIEEIAYSKLDHFNELDTIKQKAIGKNQFSTAGKMVENKGKIAGHYEDVLKLKGDKNNPIKAEINIKWV